MSTTPTSMTTVSNAITHHWREQVDALTVPGNARKCEQQRILNKLAALWGEHPDMHMSHLLDEVLYKWGRGRYVPGGAFNIDDVDVEGALDSALAAEGVTVSGGWKG